jgi:hypothetical protein
MRQFLRQAGPIVPIVYVEASVNQANTASLLRKLRQFNYTFAKGIAVVCSVDNCMPVQVDKIHQEIARIKYEHKIPVYSFLLDNCTPCRSFNKFRKLLYGFKCGLDIFAGFNYL